MYTAVSSSLRVLQAPTSGGKSLVGDILLFHRLQQNVSDWRAPRAKCLVLVPYLSIGMVPNSDLQFSGDFLTFSSVPCYVS